ncbi:MAG: hypothetical protein C0403_09240, partial [Desulfobacterium sp.]|nr:hypothetical protein [Desulfobacterium sp.]
RRKPMSRKELKILDSSFRRNYNNRLLKLAHKNKMNEKSIYYIFEGSVLFWDNLTDNEIHKHNAIQILISTDKHFRLFYNGNEHLHYAALVPSNVPHQVLSSGNRIFIMLIDSEMITAKRLSDKYLKNKCVKDISNIIKPSDLAWIPHRINSCSCEEVIHIQNEIFNFLLDSKETIHSTIDPRIQLALRAIKALDVKKISIKEIASEVTLSESRLMHVFKENTGIPIRKYLLWLRLIEATRQLLNNVSLTDAAHNAGFTDSAHLSRTFRQMLGLTGASIFKNSRFVQVISCLG